MVGVVAEDIVVVVVVVVVIAVVIGVVAFFLFFFFFFVVYTYWSRPPNIHCQCQKKGSGRNVYTIGKEDQQI